MLSPDPALIERLLRDDVPSLDLTSAVLELPPVRSRMTFVAREPLVLAGVSTVVALLERCGAAVVSVADPGRWAEPGQALLVAEGTAVQLHLAWKVCANVLEFAGGVATRTARLVEAARTVTPDIEVLATRKLVPGTKEIAIEAVTSGGALPHRLGLSETVLVFDQHTVFLGGVEGLIARLPQVAARAGGKPVVVEVTSVAEAVALAEAGVGGLQFDKLGPAELAAAVAAVRHVAPQLRLLAAGGINAANAASYAATGVNGLVSSWMYTGTGTDVGVTIAPGVPESASEPFAAPSYGGC
ncbi:MAG: ModD protein [Actinobacteria bacterium HGW-Actinobacteria-2]|nr:MAG: ModD protein [Actinobacteria bacterium HGW-Actinobacteria-2]